MFYRNDDNLAVGVLCDWDLAQDRSLLGPDRFERLVDDASQVLWAEEKEDEDKGENIEEVTVAARDGRLRAQGGQASEGLPHCRARYRTGTGPFMAIDLLVEQDIPYHQYRHDLESFFYVLVWFCAGFHPRCHKIERITSWLTPQLSDIGYRKKSFIETAAIRDTILRSVATEYKTLVSRWVAELRILFANFVNKTQCIKILLEEVANAEESGNLELVMKYKAKMNRKILERRDMVTFETFMKCLGPT